MPVVPTKELPQQSLILTHAEVCQFQQDFIQSWNRKSDVWSFTFGSGILSACATITSAWIGNALRLSYKVSKRNAALVMLPVICIPPCIIYSVQTMSVLSDIYLYDSKKCILCPMVKSAFNQVGLGVAYPLLIANCLSWGVAYRESRVLYNVPHYTEYSKAAGYLYAHNRPFFPRIALLFVLSVIVSQGMTYYQHEQWMKLKNYTALMEEDSRESIREKSKLIAEREKRLLHRKIQEIEEKKQNVKDKELLQ